MKKEKMRCSKPSFLMEWGLYLSCGRCLPPSFLGVFLVWAPKSIQDAIIPSKASVCTNGGSGMWLVHGNRSHPFSSVARNRLTNMTSHRSYIGTKGTNGLELGSVHAYPCIYTCKVVFLGDQIVSDTLQIQRCSPEQQCHSPCGGCQ